MAKRTRINKIRHRYPNCDLFNGYDGYDDEIEPEYDPELDIPDWERVNI